MHPRPPPPREGNILSRACVLGYIITSCKLAVSAMEDSLAGKAVRIGVLQTLRLRPGFDILKSWQGKVEIALRSVAAVSLN